jgi:small-conductance mechanosensitive channel
MEFFSSPGGALLWSVIVLASAAAVGLLLHLVVFRLATRITSRTASKVDGLAVRRMKRPLQLLLPLLLTLFVLEGASGLRLPEAALGLVRHFLGLLLILAVAWLVVSLTRVADDLVEARFPLDVRDNLQARQITTQVQVLRRVAAVFIAFVTIAAMLMTFPQIRQLGTSLLASAGLAGLVVGMAARPALANLIAGVQLALTQPIRLDDVVVVEGEWGRIEDIRTTFVVVRIWDERRLVVPLSYFMDHPIENWTRESAELLGTVFLYADYRVPVEELRKKLKEILEASGLWDGRAWGLQVTDATPRSIEIRAVMSAVDSGTAWNLRCRVREELIRFLQAEYPDALPRTRAEIHPEEVTRARRQGEVT